MIKVTMNITELLYIYERYTLLKKWGNIQSPVFTPFVNSTPGTKNLFCARFCLNGINILNNELVGEHIIIFNGSFIIQFFFLEVYSFILFASKSK